MENLKLNNVTSKDISDNLTTDNSILTKDQVKDLLKLESTIVIKKYANRKLYDTKESKYIKVSHIRNMIEENVKFKVIENSTGLDITTNVIKRVISDHIMCMQASEKMLLNILKAVSL